MTTEKSVGRFEQLMLTAIASIIGTYLVGDALLQLMMPTSMAWVLGLVVVGYFVNRVWIQCERWVENVMLIARLRAEADRTLDLAPRLVTDAQMKQCVDAIISLAETVTSKIDKQMSPSVP